MANVKHGTSMLWRQARVRQLLVAAALIEMKMRVDDKIDTGGRDLERRRTRGNFLTGFESHL